MVEIVGVRFMQAGKIYYFDPTNRKFEVGDKVIVPPASTRKQAKENVEKYPDGYDWWFRYRDL